jgi:hypothetical protein
METDGLILQLEPLWGTLDCGKLVQGKVCFQGILRFGILQHVR